MPTWRSHVSRFSAGTSAGKEMEDAPDGPPEEAIFFFPSRMLGVSTFLVFHGLRHFSEIETNWLVVSSVCFFSSMHCLLGVTV